MKRDVVERKKGICSNFMFALLEHFDNSPVEAAEAIFACLGKSVDYLFPKEFNHKTLRNEWSMVFITTLIFHLEMQLQELKDANDK